MGILNYPPYYNKIMRGQSRSNRRDKKKKQKSSYQEKTHFSEIKDIHARTVNQQSMMDCISDYNITLVSGAAGTGKANPNYTPVLTPEGYVPMGNIKVGDFVMSQDGKPTEVLGVYPQGKKDIYQVLFTDGTIGESCLEHLWNVRTRKQRSQNKPFKTVELGDIIDEVNKPRISTKNAYKYEIPLNEPLQFETKNQPIPPYELGLLLGDGYFVKTGSHRFITSEQDYDFFREQLTNINSTGLYNGVYHLNANCFKQEFKELGLTGLKSGDKFIPSTYLYGDIEQRLAILRGLMDTDGSVYKNRISYSTTSLPLAEGVMFLVRSLGGVATMQEDRRKDKYTSGHCFHVCVQLKTINVFSLPRKAKQVKVTKVKPGKRIKSITFKSKEECTCIYVANSSHLYLINDCIVTHNSLIAFYKGIKLLDKGLIDQILYIKPIVDFKDCRGLGYLPGDLDEKLEPLLTSVHDSLDMFLSKGKKDILLKKKQIEFQPLEYIRGRSLRDKFVVLDESQNTTPHGLLTVISRLEESSKLVVLGDPMQADVFHKGLDGLTDAINRLTGLDEVGLVQFTHNDIQRAGFLKDVIRRYQK